jgi:hypothetical protein
MYETIKEIDFLTARLVIAAEEGDLEKVMTASFELRDHITDLRRALLFGFHTEKETKPNGSSRGIVVFLENMERKPKRYQ